MSRYAEFWVALRVRLRARAKEIYRLAERGEFTDDIAAARIDELSMTVEIVDELLQAEIERVKKNQSNRRGRQ